MKAKEKKKATENEKTKDRAEEHGVEALSSSKHPKKDPRGRPKMMGTFEDIISALERAVDTIEGNIMHPWKQLQWEEEYEKGVEE